MIQQSHSSEYSEKRKLSFEKICADKYEILQFIATRMGLEKIMLSEKKTEKDKYYMISFICGI